MFTFEIGHKYFDTSACDHNCVFTIEIVKRTAKTVTFVRNGKTRRAKLFTDDRGEYIIPDRYSMAPVFRAEREVQPEEPADVEETADDSAEEAAPGFTVSQPADETAVLVMIGQRVECVCGACYPEQGGTVIGFEDIPDGRFFRGGVHAVIRWDDRPDRPERVRLSDIHRRGWRSPGGSPLGVFVP
jgi:hypothetical protein